MGHFLMATVPNRGHSLIAENKLFVPGRMIILIQNGQYTRIRWKVRNCKHNLTLPEFSARFCGNISNRSSLQAALLSSTISAAPPSNGNLLECYKFENMTRSTEREYIIHGRQSCRVI